jgi:protein-S-isoprenylcysteine O-methyltransferase Ste14
MNARLARTLLLLLLLLWAVLCVYLAYIADIEQSDCAAKGGVILTDGCYRVTKEKIK